MSTGAPAVPDGGLRMGEPRARWVLAIVILGSAIAQLEATVVNVALPAIGEDLGAGVAGLQWTTSGYLLTLASLILLGGALGDRLGRRRVFVIGVVWFTATSAACAVVPSVEWLVAMRVLQGVGGALLTPGSLAIIEATFAREDRARAIGAWSALGGVAAAGGPLLGGWLVDAISWRWIFIINVPLGAFVVWGAARHVPETRDPTATGRLDLPGGLLATVGLGAATFALIQAGAEGGPSGAVLTVIGALGVLALAAFVVHERRTRAPMLPTAVFASRAFAAANGVTFALYAALGGVLFLLVVVLQNALGLSALQAGGALLPVTVLMLVLSARAGAIAQRVGPRPLLVAGPLLVALSMLMLARIGPGDTYLADVLPAMVVLGLGLSATVAPVTATALAAAGDRYAGAASGVNNAIARTAGLVAVAVLPLIAGLSGDDYRDPQALADAFTVAMLVCAGLAAAAAVLAAVLVPRGRLDELGGGSAPTPAPTHCAVAGPPPPCGGRDGAASPDAPPVAVGARGG